MPDDVKPNDDSYQALRNKYGIADVPGRTMGKYGPISENQKPDFFNMKTQLISDGRGIKPLAETDNLWAWIKVYSSGGENSLHAHQNEDHMFVVLSGEAVFRGPNGEEKAVGRNEGIMLPAGSIYSFVCSSEDPLVLLRVGARAGDGDLRDRRGANGAPLAGSSKENKFKRGVVDEGKFFE